MPPPAPHSPSSVELRRAMDDVPGVIYALVHLAWVLRIGLDEVAAARPLLGRPWLWHMNAAWSTSGCCPLESRGSGAV